MSEATDKDEADSAALLPNSGSDDRLSAVQADIDAVQDSMRENMGRVLERGTKMEVLEQKSDDLSSSAMAFQRSGAGLRRHMWWQKRKMMIFGVIAGFFILLIIIIYESSKKNSSKGHSGNSTNSTDSTVSETSNRLLEKSI